MFLTIDDLYQGLIAKIGTVKNPTDGSLMLSIVGIGGERAIQIYNDSQYTLTISTTEFWDGTLSPFKVTTPYGNINESVYTLYGELDEVVEPILGFLEQELYRIGNKLPQYADGCEFCMSFNPHLSFS